MEDSPVDPDNLAARLRRLFGRAGRSVREIILPAMCPACREPVEQGGGLCAACWSRLSFITPPLCERTGLPFAFDPGEAILSRAAMADPPAWDRARATVRFGDVARDLVHQLKYGDRLDLAPLISRFMWVAGEEMLKDADALVPVPLHWTRLWKRRFNQAAVLAQGVAKHANLPVELDVVKRVRRTPAQVGLDKADRRRNVDAAFMVPEEMRGRVHGRRLVLIDDVLTTGATLDALARVLSRAGAARVDVLVFARVVQEG